MLLREVIHIFNKFKEIKKKIAYKIVLTQY